MTKNNLSWITKAIPAVLIVLGGLTGIFILSNILPESLELLAIIGLSMFYFMIVPVLIRRTKRTLKSIIISVAVLIAPFVPIGLLVFIKYHWYGRPLATMTSLVDVGRGKPIFTVASIVFLSCVLALCFYFQLRRCTGKRFGSE